MVKLLLVFAFLSNAAFAQMPVRAVSSGHVTVFRPIDVDGGVANGYLSLLEQIYETYSNRLQFGHDGRLIVRLCHDKYDFSELTGADSIFSPLWKDGTLYIIALDDIDRPGYRTEMETGVIQGVLSGMRRNGAPAWLVYSIAVYESGEYEGLTPPPFENVKYFSDLEEKMQSARSATDLSDLIYYLGNTGKFIDTKFGVGSLMRLMHEFDRFTGFSVAVNDAFHISVSELERDWHQYLRSLANS